MITPTIETTTRETTMKTTFALTITLTIAAALGMACGTEPDASHPDGVAASGEALFTTNCTSCHGADARSGNARQNLPEAIADDGVDEIFSIISNGKDNGAMPAFADKLSEQEIADIIAWIKTQ